MPRSHLRTAYVTVVGILLLILVAFTVPADARPAASTTDTTRTLIVVDGAVADADLLLPADAEAIVLRLGSGDDALQAIADTLAIEHDIGALHVLSHGAPGGVSLGGAWLDAGALDARTATLKTIRDRLTDQADVLFWGCEVAADEGGRVFVDRFAELTGTNVAASTGLVGSAALGGNWSLEYATGAITASTPFEAEGMSGYAHVLSHGRGGSITWQPIYDEDGVLAHVEITAKSGWRANWGQNPVNFNVDTIPALPLVRQSADIRTHGHGDGQEALNADDPAYDHLSQHVDFELIGLDAPGQAAMVVVPLMTAIPENAVWRKYHADDGWFTFSTDGANALHSAAVNTSGDCPAPGSAGWQAGLNAGHDCVRLTIVDGDINDVDREANGVIRDPGVLAAANDDAGQAPSDMVVTSGGGGAVGVLPLLIGALLFGAAAARRHWRRIAAVAALVLAFPLAAQSASVEESWYAGVQIGQARGDTGAGDVNRALAARAAAPAVRPRCSVWASRMVLWTSWVCA